MATAGSLSACKGASSSSAPDKAAAPSVSPPASGAVSAVALPVLPPPEAPGVDTVPTAWPISDGPLLGIFAGEGVGAIRLGANVETIERLMAAPCDVKTPEVCRYIGRATEFFLKDGVTFEIHTHRQDRPTTPKPRVFGVFNGRTPEGVAFTMLQPAARELLGAPIKTEVVQDGGENHTMAIDIYDGLRVEYDRLPKGSIGVGGMVIVKSTKTPSPKKTDKAKKK
ncbi:MAG TPA: hypothetical protein VF395_11015 [Polyangiaceae bacterium]